MRFYEFAYPLFENNSAAVDNLIAVLNLIKYRMEKEDADTPITKGTIINLVRNSGIASFDENDLTTAWDTSPAVKNLIQQPVRDQDTIQFNQDDDAEEPSIDDIGVDLPPEGQLPTEPGQLGMGTEMPTGMEPMGPESEMPVTSSGPPEGPTGDRQTVSQMADRALKRRQ